MSETARLDLAITAPFRIGALCVEPALRQVSTAETEPETLEPRVMLVLVALARAEGAIVSRDRLIEQCWDNRIVGDDSINRVISRLRKLAGANGDVVFAIETISKVGYRLVGPVALVAPSQPEPRPEPFKPALTALNAVAAFKAPSARKSGFWTGLWPKSWKIAAVVAVLAASMAAFAPWPRPQRSDDRIIVNFTGYKPLSDRIAADLPDAIADATVSAFTEDGRVAVVSGNGAGEFRLGGSIDKVGDAIRISSRVDNARTRVTLWSRVVDIPASELVHVATRTAAVTAQLTRCAISQQAAYGKPLSDKVLTLLFAECAVELTGDTPEKALDLARRITIAQPDLASGWSTLAFTANGSSIYGTPLAVAPPLRQEAQRAVTRALALDPKDLRAWHVKVYFVPENDLVGIDRAFQAASRARMDEAGWLYMDYGVFLLDVGYGAAAREMFGRAHDVMPLHGSPLAGIGRIAAGEGRRQEAQHAFDKLDALSTGFLDTSEVITFNAMWTRDYAGALRAIASHPLVGPPAWTAAVENGFRALAGGDAAAMKKAAAKLLPVSDNCQCNGTFQIRIVAALGDAKGAFDSLAALALKNPRAAREAAAWDPVFQDVRRQPGFPALAKTLGLITYWQTTKVRPDFCALGNPPALCATLPNTGSAHRSI